MKKVFITRELKIKVSLSSPILGERLLTVNTFPLTHLFKMFLEQFLPFGFP